MAGLDIADAQAIEEDQGLAEVGAAEGDVGLDAVRRALLEVDGGVEPEKVHQGVGEQGTLRTDVLDLDVAVGFFERNGVVGSGDDEGLVLLGKGRGVWAAKIAAQSTGQTKVCRTGVTRLRGLR